jgi:ABC-2 type transport system permease protein
MIHFIWRVVGVLLLVAVGALYLSFPEWSWFNGSVFVFSLCLNIILYARRLSSPQFYKSLLDFPRLKSPVARVYFVRGILGVSCLLVFNLLWIRLPLVFDMTTQKLNSLSEQSQKIMQSLSGPVKVTLFAKREEWASSLQLLKMYQELNSSMEVQAIDLDQNPALARVQNVQQSPTVILESAGKKILFLLDGEKSFTQALTKLSRPQNPKIVIVNGYAAPTCKDESPVGLSAFCQHLKEQLFEIEESDLTKWRDIPEDVSLLMVVGLHQTMLKKEVQKIQRYLEKGGSVLWAQSPQFGNDFHESLRQLVRNWGLQLERNLVLDVSGTQQGKEATIVQVEKFHEQHPLLKNFKGPLVLPLSSSITEVTPLYENVATTTLAFSADFPQAWGETNFLEIEKGQVQADPLKDLKGPLALVAISERVLESTKDTRLMVIGNDFLFTNELQGQLSNYQFLFNSLSWLSHQDSLIAFNRPGLQNEPVVLSDLFLGLVFYFYVVITPLVCFGFAFYWYRRRTVSA